MAEPYETEKAVIETRPSHDSAVDHRELKLDKHGLPLVPQPTSRKDDPLVCAGSSVTIFS